MTDICKPKCKLVLYWIKDQDCFFGFVFNSGHVRISPFASRNVAQPIYSVCVVRQKVAPPISRES